MVARILLLEGAAEREESLAPRLSAEGFDVLAEKDPAKGVQMASEKQPDVIVINGRLPGCSASDIVKQLHTAEPTGLLPVVQIVDSTPQDPQALLDDGADDYLARPLDWPAFLALLSARTRRWREWNAFYNRRIEQTRSKVVQALSHEVFYPLLEIEANGEYLARSEAVAGASAVADTGREIVSAAHRLHRMLGKLMLAATLEEETAGAESRLPAGGQTADAYAIVKQTAVQTAQLCGREEELVLALEPAWAQVAAVDLEWIVEELVRHAFSVSPPGAAVSVASRAKRRYELTVTAAPEVIAERASVYLPAGHRTTSALGLEIGLEIVRRLAVMHGGSLEVRRKAGKGIRAVVELPRAKKPRPVDA